MPGNKRNLLFFFIFSALIVGGEICGILWNGFSRHETAFATHFTSVTVQDSKLRRFIMRTCRVMLDFTFYDYCTPEKERDSWSNSVNK